MGDDGKQGLRAERGDSARVGRRPLLAALGAIGAGKGALGGVGTGRGAAVNGWTGQGESYYDALATDLESMGLPDGEFVYGDDEAATLAAFELLGEAGEREAIDAPEDEPFAEAVRIDVTEETENPWDVNLIGEVADRAVSDVDVLLGVAYLRAPEGDAEAQFVAKDEDNVETNMVRNPLPDVGTEWQRHYFPIEFTYDADAGTWWTEFFLGYGEQTIDLGGLALIDYGDAVALDDLPEGVADADGDRDSEWEVAADERIAEHRMADLTVEVTDRDGNPVEGAAVEVSMQEHEFGFGTAIDAGHLVDETEPGDEYRERVTELFNLAVLGNHHKWRFWEEERETADAATEWVLEQGLDLRGHVCLWANVSGWAVPPDVVDAMGVEWEDNGVTDPELDPEYVRERASEHVAEIIEYYGDDVVEWDVHNETVHEPGLVEAANGVVPGDEDDELDVPAVQNPVLAEWYEIAEDAAPEGVSIATNDYNVLAGPHGYARDAYEQQLAFLDDEGIDIGGAGLQCHFSEGETLSAAEIMAGLDRYAEYADELRITEFDMADENWAEADKADFFSRFLKTVFSHPDVGDFLLWGITDPLHWRDDAPLFDEDWNPKPAHDVYTDLVFDEWWTEETAETDGAGTASVRGFKGEYAVTVEHDGQSVSEEVTLSDGGASVEVVLNGVTAETGTETAGGPTTAATRVEADGSTSTAADGSGLGAVSALAGLAGLVSLALGRRNDTERD